MARKKKTSAKTKRKMSSKKPLKSTDKLSSRINKLKDTHPWRLCPPGEHWVRIHPRNIPAGGATEVTGHCRANPSGKDQIYAFELKEIAEKHFSGLDSTPTGNSLGYSQGNNYDQLIAGWTKYWNDILKPKLALDPNLIKVLIATESSFNPNADVLASKKNWARGLTQITDQTIKILADEKGEIKDHLINIDQKEAYDPNLNIAAGIRWLFHKKDLLEKKKRREVTWEEAVMEYKSYAKDIAAGKPRALKKQKEFLEMYEKLKGKK